MYKRVLLPLDGSEDSEKVIEPVRGELGSGTQVLILKVVPPGGSPELADSPMSPVEREEKATCDTRAYLIKLIERLGEDPERWHAEAIVADSVADGIVGFAESHDVDLIAMCAEERKGIGKFFKGNTVAQDVQAKAPIEVKVFPVA